jgi:tetratricopeptide (TPR) repeat protein
MPVNPPSEAGAEPRLTPPGKRTVQGSNEAGQYRMLWIALLAILVLGLAVIFALPAFIQSPQQAGAPANTAVLTGVESRDTANESMQAWLQLRARLELEHASQWGEPIWSQSQQAADSGARMLAQRQFIEAAEFYNQALQGLQQLASGTDTRLAAALAAAQQALERNELDVALKQFELALVIEANNEDARYGLARTQTRQTVLENMAAGERAEANGDLMAALTAYQEAALLDPEYEPPTAAFNRVSELLETGAFQDAMTRTMTALDNYQNGYRGALIVAEKALAEARAIHPSDAAVLDAQQRVKQARHQARLDSFRRQAANMVKTENWLGAGNVYKRALAVDSTVGFAQTGIEEAEARLEVNRQFDHYLKNPERLYDEEPLANAEQLLAAVGSAPADEPKLAKKIVTLRQRVSQAGIPITVSLSSDGATDVSIYHVGQLGTFTNRQIELLPGDYTVVGARPGYRDVLKKLAVIPGKQDVSLSISCEEII